MRKDMICKILIYALLFCVLLTAAGCSVTDTAPEASGTPSEDESYPTDSSGEGADTEAEEAAAVKVVDKFGVWPPKTDDPYYTSKVGMWYTLWWTAEGTPTYRYWTEWTRLKPVEFGYYSSGDADYLKTNLTYFYNIGIDYLVLDDTNGHWNPIYCNAIHNNMNSCYEAAASLDGKTPQIAVATGAKIRERDAEGQKGEADLYYNNFVSRYPEVYFKWKDKPLLLVYYGGGSFSTAYNDGRFTVRNGTGRASWGVGQGIIDDACGNWAWVFDRQWPESEIYGVQAGYDASAGKEDREKGQRYINEWLEAIKTNPQTIMIPSWNDHAEYTSIEPADWPDGEDPFFYEKATEAYLALRYGFIEGFYYRAESDTKVYRYTGSELVCQTSAPPASEPVIIIPDNYYDWVGIRP